MPHFNRDSARRIAEQTRRLERQPVNTLRQKTRRTPPQDCKCAAYKYRIMLLGEPTSGTFALSFTWAEDSVGTNGVETVDINWNETPEQLKSKLLDLEGVADRDETNPAFALENGVTAEGEDFPFGVIIFRLIGKGKGGRLIELAVSDNALTGGAHTRVRIEPLCC